MEKYIKLIVQVPFVVVALIVCYLFLISFYPVAWLIFCWKYLFNMDDKKRAVKAMHELFIFIFLNSLEMIKGQIRD